jgi:hypothetical protein
VVRQRGEFNKQHLRGFIKMNQHAILKDKIVIPINTRDEAGLIRWFSWLENADRVIAKTQFSPEVLVSTVFLGINHGFGERPLWFETMVFGGAFDGYLDRYETWEQAFKGHQHVLDLVRNDILELGRKGN